MGVGCHIRGQIAAPLDCLLAVPCRIVAASEPGPPFDINITGHQSRLRYEPRRRDNTLKRDHMSKPAPILLVLALRDEAEKARR